MLDPFAHLDDISIQEDVAPQVDNLSKSNIERPTQPQRFRALYVFAKCFGQCHPAQPCAPRCQSVDTPRLATFENNSEHLWLNHICRPVPLHQIVRTDGHAIFEVCFVRQILFVAPYRTVVSCSQCLQQPPEAN